MNTRSALLDDGNRGDAGGQGGVEGKRIATQVDAQGDGFGSLGGCCPGYKQSQGRSENEGQTGFRLRTHPFFVASHNNQL